MIISRYLDIWLAVHHSIGCPTTYQTRHFFNNSKINEDIATKQTHTTDTFLFIYHTTDVLLFKSRCNIFIGFRTIKEMPGLVGSGTPCITYLLFSTWCTNLLFIYTNYIKLDHQEVNDVNCTYAASGIVTLCRWLFCATAKEGVLP